MSSPVKGKPWYKEPWPWLLMVGPVAVIVAGVVTLWLAIKSSDGLVTEEYYKQGLAAKQTIARGRRAEELGIEVRLRLRADGVALRLESRDRGFAAPERITLTLSHPTRAGLDQTSKLSRTAEGYAGKLHLPAAGHWLVLIEDEAGTWRLLGNAVLPVQGDIVIGNAEGGAQR